MSVGISPHAIDHISLIMIAGSQNIIGIAVISFAGSTPEGTERSSLPPTRPCLPIAPGLRQFIFGGRNSRRERCLNRLSDLLFTFARRTNHVAGIADVPWVAPKK